MNRLLIPANVLDHSSGRPLCAESRRSFREAAFDLTALQQSGRLQSGRPLARGLTGRIAATGHIEAQCAIVHCTAGYLPDNVAACVVESDGLMSDEKLRGIVRCELNSGEHPRQGSPVRIAEKIADRHGMLVTATLVRLVIEERDVNAQRPVAAGHLRSER